MFIPKSLGLLNLHLTNDCVFSISRCVEVDLQYIEESVVERTFNQVKVFRQCLGNFLVVSALCPLRRVFICCATGYVCFAVQVMCTSSSTRMTISRTLTTNLGENPSKSHFAHELARTLPQL